MKNKAIDAFEIMPLFWPSLMSMVMMRKQSPSPAVDNNRRPRRPTFSTCGPEIQEKTK